MPIHDHRGGSIPGSYDPNSPVNGAPPPEPTAEQIAAFKAQMADEMAAKQAANEKETHESRKIVSRELAQRAVKVDFQENLAIKDSTITGTGGVNAVRGGMTVLGVESSMPVIEHTRIHVHEIPTVDGMRGKTLERHEAGHPAQPGEPGYGAGAGQPVPIVFDVGSPQNPEIKLERVAGPRARAAVLPESDPIVVPGQIPVIEKPVVFAAIRTETGDLDLSGDGHAPKRAVPLPEEAKPAEAFVVPDFSAGNSRIKPFFQKAAVRAGVPEGVTYGQGPVPAKAPGQEVPYLPPVAGRTEIPAVPGDGTRVPIDPAVRLSMPVSAGLDPRDMPRFRAERPVQDIPQPGSVYFPSQKTPYIPPVAEKPAVDGVIAPGEAPIVPDVDAPVHIKAVVPGAQPSEPSIPVRHNVQEPVGEDPIRLDPIITPESPEGVRFTSRPDAVTVVLETVPGIPETDPGIPEAVPAIPETVHAAVVVGEPRVPVAHAETYGERPLRTDADIEASAEFHVRAAEIPAEEKPREIQRRDPAALEPSEEETVRLEPVEHARRAEEPAGPESRPVAEIIEPPADETGIIPEGNPILAVRTVEAPEIPAVEVSFAVSAPTEKPLATGMEMPLDGSRPEDQVWAQHDLAFQSSQPVRFAEGAVENPEIRPADRLVVRAEAGTEVRAVDHDRPGEIPSERGEDSFLAEQTDRKRADRIDDHEDDLPPIAVPGHVHRSEFDPILFNANPGYQPPMRDQHESTLAHEVVNMVDRFLVTAEQGSYVKEVHMTMNHEILPGTEIQFRQVGNSLVVTFVNMDGGNLELLRREAPDLAESLRSHTGEAVEIRIVTAVGGETV